MKKHLIPLAGLFTGYAFVIAIVFWLADDYSMPLFGLSAFSAKAYLLSLFTLVLVVRVVLILKGKDKISNSIDRWFR